MKLFRIVAAAATVALAGCSAFPGPDTGRAEACGSHHPPSHAATGVDPARFDQQMKTMREMHQAMMAAKTPAERAALMKEHMKAMEGGMAMMGPMGGCMAMHDGKHSMPADMMQRMDMMEMMMRMMMDREAARSPAAR